LLTFCIVLLAAAPVNPFAAATQATQQKPTMNQMMQQSGGISADPWAPVSSFPKPANSSNMPNPFFS